MGSESHIVEYLKAEATKTWKVMAQQELQWSLGQVDYHLPGGESYNNVRARFVPFVEQVVAKYEGSVDTVVFISHGSVLTNMLSHLLINIDTDFAHQNSLHNCAYVVASRIESRLTCLEWCGKTLQAGVL